MRKFTFMLLAILALSACEPTVYDVSYYRDDPDRRKVNMDGATIYVLPQMGGYVAWGGEQYRDGKFIKYRQRRAIEIYSKCRIDEVLSKPVDTVLYATVNC